MIFSSYKTHCHTDHGRYFSYYSIINDAVLKPHVSCSEVLQVVTGSLEVMLLVQIVLILACRTCLIQN